MRPMSLRARSISITCSARSFGSLMSSTSAALSSSIDAPRGRVPASGRMVIFCSPSPVFSWRTRISGEAPTTWKSPRL
ncbi:hypothetical protein D9M68_564770 [compost metagenome]